MTMFPRYMVRMGSFILTYAEWVANGCPRRAPEWVQELFAICRVCPEYRPDGRTELGSVGTCDLCGCHVGPNADENLNKLAIPYTGCPLQKWGPAVKKGQNDA